ncbi:MAG: glycosyltransferase [Bacilli bacterium]|nr:glycosyltransferase [Bacilli bacterium]
MGNNVEEEYQPLVSIITPMYNAEPYLSQTIVSVLRQSYTNWEWIIVDDGSTDRSLYLANNIIKDPRIKVLSLGKNCGAAKARNTGLDNAKGDYIVFLDADDELDTRFLDVQIKFIQEDGPIVTAGYRRRTPNSLTNFVPPYEITLDMILKGNPISCLTTMYDFHVFHEDRFDETIGRHEDFLFWIKFLNKGYRAFGSQQILATYNLHKGSKNISKKKLVMPMYRLYRKQLGFGVFKSIHYLLCMIRYSRKKYRNAK